MGALIDQDAMLKIFDESVKKLCTKEIDELMNRIQLFLQIGKSMSAK